jgi:tRNA uridine 5-carbamoylmethylation protein Kti12
MRYEAPNESNRWDFPLFKVTLFSSATTKNNADNAVTAEAAVGDVAGALSELAVKEAEVAAPPAQSSFKSSWKPKKKVATDAAGASGADDATVFTLSAATVATTATTQTQKAISFSGMMVVQEVTALSGFISPEEVLPKIIDYFGGAVAPAPNSSTIAVQKANADLLYMLDRTSQQIIQTIVAHQSEGVAEGTPVKFVEFDRALTLNRYASLAELQRYRLQYVKINGQHPPTSSKAIGSAFIDFLALHI